MWPTYTATATIHGLGWRGRIVSVSKTAVAFRCQGEAVLAEVSRCAFLQQCKLLVPSSHTLWGLPKDAVDILCSYCSLCNLFALYGTCRLGTDGVASFFHTNPMVRRPFGRRGGCGVQDFAADVGTAVFNLRSQRQSRICTISKGVQVVKKHSTEVTAIAVSGVFVALAETVTGGSGSRVKLYNVTDRRTSESCIYACTYYYSPITALLFHGDRPAKGSSGFLVVGGKSGELFYLSIQVHNQLLYSQARSPVACQVLPWCLHTDERLSRYLDTNVDTNAPGVCALSNTYKYAKDAQHHFTVGAWEDGTVLMVCLDASSKHQTCASFRLPEKRAKAHRQHCCVATEVDESFMIVAASLGRYVDLWYLDTTTNVLQGPLGKKRNKVYEWNAWVRVPTISVGPTYQSPVTALMLYETMLWTASTSRGRIDVWEEGVRKFSFFSGHDTAVSGIVLESKGRGILTSAAEECCQPLLLHTLPCNA